MKAIGKIVFFIALAVGLLVLPGCGLFTKEKPSIKFGYIADDIFHSPSVVVMQDKKLLENEGVRVEWVEYKSEETMLDDMVKGLLDFACSGVMPVMNAQAKSGELVILASSSLEGSSLIVRDRVNSLSDLYGKKIAIPGSGSIQEVLLERLSFEQGVNLRIIEAEAADMSLHLLSGEIDGFFSLSPHPSHAAYYNLGYEILSSADILPGHQCCVLVGTKQVVDKKPDTAKSLLRVYTNAYKWFLSNQDEYVAMLAVKTDLPKTVLFEAMKTMVFPETLYCDLESMYIMARSLVQKNMLSGVDKSGVEAFIEELYKPGILEKISG